MIPRLPFRRDGTLYAWRIDRSRHAAAWDSGEGAFRSGGRWNGRGIRAVYCAFDAATAILEVAVHKGFRVLDTEAHVLTALALPDDAAIHVVAPRQVPNPHWLVPRIPLAGEQAFGDALLAAHGMGAVPSIVSRHGWNLVFDAGRAMGRYRLHGQERFALDPRLHPAGG
jgi:RES domain-containing protein